METIKLKNLKLLNFKGTRNLSIDFNQATNIFGDNATGKTTVFDAFTWLLFGKDSTDRKQFELKTLDSQNKVIPKIDHEVIATLNVEGKDIEVRRVLKEKWVKKRGSLEAEFSGNDTFYYWNGVPLKASEFQVKINNLIDEGVFKLITNPLYFNQLKWTQRREVLVSIVGDVTNNEVANDNDVFLKLISELEDKTIEEYKREISSRKKKINVDLKAIPTRIDEITRGLPESLNYTSIKEQIKVLESELKEIEDSILDKSKLLESVQKKKSENQTAIFEAKSLIQNIEFEENQKISNQENEEKAVLKELTRTLNSKTQEGNSLSNELDQLEVRKENLTVKTNELRQKWVSRNAEEIEFNENEFCCPTCKRGFEADDVDQKKETLKANFQSKKTKDLNDINIEGGNLSEELKIVEQSINEKKSLIESVKIDVNSIETRINEEKEKLQKPKGGASLEFNLSKRSDYQDLKHKISSLESNEFNTTVDNSELNAKKENVISNINILRDQLSSEAVINRGNERISDLEKEEQGLAQQISDLEFTEFNIEAFIKIKIETLENKINSKFKVVKFKMFETQINGGEVECCDTLINGVPFTDLNNASKINAGLDIINTLSNFHKVNAPIFIDNAESVNELGTTEAQLIRLVVSNDAKLKVA